MALVDFAGSPHGGAHKLLPEWNTQPKITPVLIIDHTIVGSASGAWFMFRDSTGIESHFIIRGRQSGSADGVIWQLMDTGRQADANLTANNKAISIETEDNGFDPIEKWSTAQLASLKWLHNKLVALHPTIKRLEAKDCDGPGLGYHSKMQPTPSCWTPSAGKTCPASARISQWRTVLLPAFLHPEETDDMTVDELDKYLRSDKGQDALRPVVAEEVGKAYAALARGEIDGKVDKASQHYTDSNRGTSDHLSETYAALARGEIDGDIDAHSQHFKDSHRGLATTLDTLASDIANAVAEKLTEP